MREIRTSGSMSGDVETGRKALSRHNAGTAPVLDSTDRALSDERGFLCPRQCTDRLRAVQRRGGALDKRDELVAAGGVVRVLSERDRIDRRVSRPHGGGPQRTRWSTLRALLAASGASGMGAIPMLARRRSHRGSQSWRQGAGLC